MMTFKEVCSHIFHAPATAFNFIVELILGGYEHDARGQAKKGTTSKNNIKPGFLGYIFKAINHVALSLSEFIYQHKTAIAASFWVSLILTSAMALTVFLWPAALVAIVNFPILGVSIASLAATQAAQIGIIAGLTFSAASVATWLVSTVVNTISWIVSCFKTESQKNENKNENETPKSENDDNDDDLDSDSEEEKKLEDEVDNKSSASLLSKLGGSEEGKKDVNLIDLKTTPLFNKESQGDKAVKEEVANTETPLQAASI